MSSILWVLFSVLSAVFLTVKDVSLKKSTSRLSVTQSTAVMLFILCPICLSTIFTIEKVNYDVNLLIIMLSAATLDAVAMAFYLLALRNGSLAKVVPILCFVPVFQLVLNFVFYNEVPSLFGLIGIIAATFFMFYGASSSLMSIIKDKAVYSMVCVSLLWSLSSIIHKDGSSQIGAVNWTAHICLVMFLYYSPFLIRIRVSTISLSNFSALIVPALAHLLTLLTFYHAVSIGNVAFVSSLRRLSTVFSIWIGWYKYNETVTNRLCISIFGLITSALTITLFG
ncbi:EamA family transporter [Vibrio splendidus]|uniref:EamA family transporter n=1 Tax=Vibrio splendidus TaxID=29497 RepID=UPI0035222B39